MIIEKLELVNFRNYEQLKLDFFSGCNILFGENAQGKTNILESIFILCFSRSFRTKHEREIIQFNKKYTRVYGSFINDLKIEKEVVLQYSVNEGKAIYVEHKKINRYSELIGKFPIVVLSPNDYRITSGGPLERRQLIDMFLSQASTIYLKALQKYNRVLKQRNKILNEISSNSNITRQSLEPWNFSLVESGSFLIKLRHTFITEFNPILEEKYSCLNPKGESIRFSYKPSLPFVNTDEIESSFHKIMQRKIQLECVRGITLTGPQRDDYYFEVDKRDLRSYGSRGQHKTALVALKLAEFQYLKKMREERPILLLDDLFSDLDQSREEKILHALQNIGQIFITTTRKQSLKYSDYNFKEFFIENGNAVIKK